MKKLVIILLALPLVLGSCGMGHGNFNKQKFTRLKQIEPTYTSNDDVEEEKSNENTYSEEETVQTYEEETFYSEEETVYEEEIYTEETEVDYSDDYSVNETEISEEVVFTKESENEESFRSEELNEPYRGNKEREDFQKSRTIGIWMMVLAVFLGILGIFLTLITWSEIMFYASGMVAALVIALGFYFFIKSFYQNPRSAFKNKKLAGFGLGSLWLGMVIGSIGWYLAAEVSGMAGLGLTMFWTGIGGVVICAILLILAAKLGTSGSSEE